MEAAESASKTCGLFLSYKKYPEVELLDSNSIAFTALPDKMR